MNFGLFMSVFSFLKELVFGHTSGNQKTPISSRFRKWLILILIVASLSLNYFTVTKVFKLTSAYIALDKEKKRIQYELKRIENCDLTLKTLQDLLKQDNQ